MRHATEVRSARQLQQLAKDDRRRGGKPQPNIRRLRRGCIRELARMGYDFSIEALLDRTN